MTAAAANPSHAWPSTADERTFAMWMHITLAASLIGHVVGLVVALILWVSKKDHSFYLDDHGKEVVNFQISFVIYTFISMVLVALGIGVVLLPVVYIVALVALIRGANAAHHGRLFRYPICLRFIR